MNTSHALSKFAKLANIPSKKANVVKAAKPTKKATKPAVSAKAKPSEVSRFAHLTGAGFNAGPPVIAQTQKVDEAALISKDLFVFGRIRTAAERGITGKDRAAVAARLAQAAKAIR